MAVHELRQAGKVKWCAISTFDLGQVLLLSQWLFLSYRPTALPAKVNTLHLAKQEQLPANLSSFPTMLIKNQRLGYIVCSLVAILCLGYCDVCWLFFTCSPSSPHPSLLPASLVRERCKSLSWCEKPRSSGVSLSLTHPHLCMWNPASSGDRHSRSAAKTSTFLRSRDVWLADLLK